MKLILAIILTLPFLLFSCRKDRYNVPIEETYEYSFFVAGHTYGYPLNYQYGLHPTFKKHFDYLNNYPNLEFGVLTGDVVPSATQEYWDSARIDINKIKKPIHIAAGNHDRGDIFDSLYTPYYSFITHNDLFIILNPTNWNIETEQETFLKSTILNKYKTVNNIYIFTHELIWWSPTNEFSGIKINYLPNYPGSSNYWTTIYPFLDSLDNNFYLFSGDLGATPVVTPYMYHKEKNITYIASGMGNKILDNFIMVGIDSDHKPHFKILGLNSINPEEIENLEEFILP